ncbi:transcription termination factor Rho [Actinomyces sp. B33]|uniref:transcription termination factor Rho n=1 Tax=Actinomyces sp. B33 TaxID=2942131 RepID=UPI00233FA202|nr:transcription termination factor Rho [Actinomyces sp. B33]MDC4232844.1 transcription termination factor Rho [Actinomyces sp. B33]
MSNEQGATQAKSPLSAMKLAELQALASSRGLKGISKMRKSQLIEALSDAAPASTAPARARAERAPRRAPAQEAPAASSGEQAAQAGPADAPAPEPRKSRRRRAATQDVVDPARLTLDLPAPVPPSEPEPRSEAAQRPAEALDSIELPDGDDSDSRGRGRRDRGRRNRRERDRDRQGNRRDRPRERDGRDEQPLRDDEQLAPIAGILDVQDNHAFVRTSGYLPGPNDVYVTLGNVRRWGLRAGDAVMGAVRQPREGERQQRQKYNALVRVDSVNGMSVDEAKARREFGKLTPLYPAEQLRMETSAKAYTPRVIDLVAPIGKGQRGLIVSPPKAGKTMVIQQIAKAIELNNPEVHLMVVLVDERPEEVTDMRSIVNGEVIASTFDRPASDHTIVAELAIERAKRLVELGQDVVVLLDSLTRLSRAYNLAAPASGRILSGGVDASALYPPKKFFGAARNLKEGGSLTIIASALVETGSKMDEVIFEEFKGTGNMELRLSRQLADRRIFPAIDVNASGTRREEMLFAPEELRIMWKLRRVLGTLDQQPALELVLDKLKETQSNAEFLMLVQKTTPSVD